MNKEKLSRNALKFIQKGQLAKAVKAYQEILSAEPYDVRLRLKLVDLLAKLGRKEEALDECRVVADEYSRQGFALRSVAVWKQALRISPDSPDLHVNLAEVYLQQQLLGDALGAFKKSVVLLRRQGKNDQAGTILARMEEIAPKNSAIKVLRAETLWADGEIEEFEETIERIIELLKGAGNHAKLLSVMESFMEKTGGAPSLLKPLASVYLEAGDHDRAVEMVDRARNERPQDRELSLLAVRVYLAGGRFDDARVIAMELYREDSEDLLILQQLAFIARQQGDPEGQIQWYKELARIHAGRGETGEEESYYNRILEIDPNDSEATAELARLEEGEEFLEEELINDVLEDDVIIMSEPEPEPPVAELSVPLSGPTEGIESGQPWSDDVVEGDLYLKYGLTEKAYDKLSALASKFPDAIEVRQKFRDVLWRMEDVERWGDEQVAIAKLLVVDQRQTEAIRIYEAVLETLPGHPEAVEGLGGLRSEPAEPADDQEEMLDDVVGLADVTADQPATPPDVADAYVDLQKEVLDATDLELGGSIEGFEDFEVSEVDDIVDEFKSGIADKLDEGDFDTHYSLGVAYKEMGLTDDALGEFRKASRYPEKAYLAYTSIAMIYRETGNHEDARSALKMALAIPSADPEDRVAVFYELGSLAEEVGDWTDALGMYEKVKEFNPAYRDLQQRMRAAQSRLEA